jgi:Fic family protein
VEVVAREAVDQAGRLLELRERLRADLRARPRVIPLIDELFQNPYVTVSRAQRLLGVSNPTARSHVNLLLKRGILEEVGAKSWGKLYVAWPILDVLREGE